MVAIGERRERRSGAKEGEWDYYNIEIGDELLRKHGFKRIGFSASSTKFEKKTIRSVIMGLYTPEKQLYYLSLFTYPSTRVEEIERLEREAREKLKGLEEEAEKALAELCKSWGFPEGVSVGDVRIELSQIGINVKSKDFNEAYSKIRESAKLLGLRVD